MSTKFLSPGWRMPKNANQSKSSNYSLDFDGGNQFVNSSPTLSGLTDITVSCWAKFENINNSDFQYVLIAYNTSQSGSYRVGIGMIKSNYSTASDRYKLYTIDGSNLNISSFVVSQDVWYNIVVTQSGSVRKLFVNGDLISTFTGVPSLNLGNNLEIGRFSNNNHYFPGKINSVSIFDYALSPSQVTTLWGGGTSVSNPMALPSSPIAYYPLGTSAWNGEYLAENNAIGDYVFDFNNSQEINCGSNASLNQVGSVFTMSCWINTTSGSRGSIMGTYINSGSGYYIDLMASGTVQGGYHQGAQYYLRSSSSTVNDGNWHHVCYVGSNAAGGFLNVYIDGVLNQNALQQSGPPANANSTNPFKINLDGYLGNRYTGKTSNVQVFSLALSGPEVETLYNYGSPIQTLANIPQSSNLKAWYKLDATEIYDSTTTEWEVNNALSPWTSSLSFDGNDTINLGNDSSLRITAEMTVSCWIKITDSGQNIIVGRERSGTGRDWKLYLSNGIIFFWCSANGTASDINVLPSSSTVNDGNWHNLTAINNGTNQYIYIDGVLNNSNSGGQTINASTADNYIGSRNGTAFFFNGELSNVQIFNTALTDGTGGTVNQIETLYNSGNPLTDMSSFSSLVSWWKLDNTTTGIEDSKGSNNGTNNGATEAPGSVSTLNGLSSGMSQSNLVQSDLQTVAPYSKYAMSFDGNGYIDCGSVGNFTSSFTASCWINNWPSSGQKGVLGNTNGQSQGWLLLAPHVTNSNAFKVYISTTNGWHSSENSNGFSDNTKWVNLVVVYDSINNTLMLYSNTVEGVTATQPTGTLTTGADPLRIGSEAGYNNFNGNISNAAIWNTALSASEVREIYNEGRPSNLHNFSGAAPVAWWQLGENSSFNGNDWIVADEIGSNNGESNGMPVSALTNGVGTTANGVSSGMSEGSLVGDAPYSTANAISSGMPVTARGIDVPS